MEKRLVDIFVDSTDVLWPRSGDFVCLSSEQIEDYTRQVIRECCRHIDPESADFLENKFLKT